MFSAIFLENFYNFSVANNNVCNLDINNYYSVSTITKPNPIFTIFIFTVTLPNVLYLKSHTSKIVVSANHTGPLITFCVGMSFLAELQF